MKFPLSLTSVGFAFKVLSWGIVLYAISHLKSPDPAFGYLLDFVGIGLFWAAGKLQESREWARLLFWGISLFMAGYLIWDYCLVRFLPIKGASPNMWELCAALCFIWLFSYLNQPRLKYLLVLQSARNGRRAWRNTR